MESLSRVPEVVFTTAFNEYAVHAFDINALDYLIKPLRKERFAICIEKIRKKLNGWFSENAISLRDRRIFIKDGTKCHFINLSEVHLIESMDNYARLCFGNKKKYTDH